jgi:hypothetical protein
MTPRLRLQAQDGVLQKRPINNFTNRQSGARAARTSD